jgi:cell wall-associated NlpC family hydrolase
MVLTVVLGAGGAAVADSHKPYPTQQQVDSARQDVASKTASVAAIRARLVVAQQQLAAASDKAEIAAEAYNGALWKLGEARKATRQATRDAAAARAHVEAQRSEIARLVTQSYQQGTDLNSVTALLGASGPTGLMNRMGVVESAGDSMQARYDSFTATSALAKVYEAKAKQAQAEQTRLAAKARTARDQAAALATSAQAMAAQISTQRNQLIADLAKAQQISVTLAGKRQAALEQIAREKAAAAAKAAAEAKAKAQAKAAAKAKAAAQQAAQQSQQSQQDNGGDTSSVPPPVSAPPVVSNPAPNEGAAVQRAIAFAKSQLGKPYQWGATGPGTYDCSGLTMRAWEHGGISLPHYSVAQFYASTPISMADARPGDLLFFSSNGSPSGIHHVALYLGGGTFIEAPHTGSFVRYNSIYNWYPDFVGRP